jgi:hypothetical protein
MVRLMCIATLELFSLLELCWSEPVEGNVGSLGRVGSAIPIYDCMSGDRPMGRVHQSVRRANQISLALYREV